MFKTHTEELAQFLFVTPRTQDMLKPQQYGHCTRNTTETRMHAVGCDIWASALHLRLY